MIASIHKNLNGTVYWLTTVMLSQCVCAQTEPANIQPLASRPLSEKFTLKWSDEFDGNAIDTAKWNFRTDSRMWSTQKAANVSQKDGCLTIGLRKENAGEKKYTGGGVISKGQFSYGYYEARLRCPSNTGWHTSFWMMNWGGKLDQEIDVCEQDSIDSDSYSVNVHDYHPKNHSLGEHRINAQGLASAFHVYGCEYTKNRIVFYFDGKEVARYGIGGVVQGLQNIWITSIASNGNHTKAVDDAGLPGAAVFDYVRYFSSEQ